MSVSRSSQSNAPHDRTSHSRTSHNRTSQNGAPQNNVEAVDSASSRAAEEPIELSQRELEILEQVAAGLTNQEISEQLAISKRTVDNHVSNILSKTATGNRVALVRWALQSGKVCIDELNCCHLPDAK